jgi:acetyl esterase/lipase
LRQRVHYGSRHPQSAEVWRPEQQDGPAPVVVLIHGGYWRAIYTKRLMRRLAAAVVARGWVAYNIEYRRVGPLGGHGGWPATFDDVAAAMDHLTELEGIDLARVVTCGHSAGGHLALWAAGRAGLPAGVPGADPKVLPCGAISLAGVVDLDRAAALGLGGGAVPALLGGPPTDHPERYAVASPAALLPLGVPQVLIHGLADAIVPASLSEEYVDAAKACGDPAVYVPLAGLGHMEMIDPGSAAWAAAEEHLDRLFAPPPT